MNIKNKKIDPHKTDYLLHCDYTQLGRLVSSAALEAPTVASVLLERDLSYLMRRVKPDSGGCHMDASVRMTCAFLELSDPFPDYVGKRAI